MVLCDPFAINVIGKSIIKVLTHLTNTEALPRVCFFLCKIAYSEGAIELGELDLLQVDSYCCEI
jgi:uracil phosphoribosyltransferase